MSETEPPPPPPPLPGRPRRPRPAARAVRWGAELATVFVGVYAAFMLNSYQSHRQERQRREQLLAWVDQEFSESLDEIRREREGMQKEADTFNHRLTAGEMPELHAFNFASDYDPSDTASVLGSGGFELLEVETVHQIKDTEATIRLLISLARHDQQLSDALILPNLEKDRSFFYDPATRQLRPAYHWYAEFYPSFLHGFDAMISKIEKLLAQVHAERQRNR